MWMEKSNYSIFRILKHSSSIILIYFSVPKEILKSKLVNVLEQKFVLIW